MAMRNRFLIVPVLLFTLLVGGCGGASPTTADAGSASSTSQSAGGSSSSSSAGTSSSAGCPTSNTRTFAKTRFLTDVGGSLFLMNRYVLKPYQAGKFKKGASGRTFAIIKAGAAAVATAKLLKNATENAKANPTLCKTLAGPLTDLSNAVSGAVDGLKSGSLDTGALAGLSGLVGSVKSGAGKAGLPITEQQVPLG